MNQGNIYTHVPDVTHLCLFTLPNIYYVPPFSSIVIYPNILLIHRDFCLLTAMVMNEESHSCFMQEYDTLNQVDTHLLNIISVYMKISK